MDAAVLHAERSGDHTGVTPPARFLRAAGGAVAPREPSLMRVLTSGEAVVPGDVFFEYGSTWAGWVIRAGSALDGDHSRYNHTGIVLDVTDDYWVTAEAHAGAGHRAMVRSDFDGIVVRVSDDPAVRELVVQGARDRLGLEYDNLSIARIGLGILGPVATPLRVWVPDADNPDKVICSEVVREVVEEALGRTIVGLEDLPAWKTTPSRLADAMIGRRSGPVTLL